MILHYFKIAFRNILKYRSQTLISLIGLAVGFACFALATLWIRYEMTYDSFHKNAKQKYVVYSPDIFSPTGYGRRSPNQLADYLKETFPEIADATPVIPAYRTGTVMKEGVEIPAKIIGTDSSFLRMFDVKILEGSRDFLIVGSNKIAITRKKARQLFGDENPIGKTVNNGAFEICAVVSEMPKQSNYPFEMICSFYDQSAGSRGENTIIELHPGTNIETFEKKLYAHETNRIGGYTLINMTIKPLTKLRYIDSNIERNVKFQYIVIFSVSGLLVILCALFNYLTLFVSRFRIRQKELALRVICGSSGGSLFAMLSVEFLLTLFSSILLGAMMTQFFLPRFLTLSEISMNLPAIYRESLMYICGIILISLLFFWLLLFIFRHRNLNFSIRRSNQRLSRKTSVVVQLVISVGFAFCTVVILKQMYYLNHTDELGFSFQNRGTMRLQGRGNTGEDGVLINQLKQIPEITEIVDASTLSNLLPQGSRMSIDVSAWDNQPADAEVIENFERWFVTPEYCDFYEFQLIAGEMLTDADADSMVLINESAMKIFGWFDAVGKRFEAGRLKYTVKGVIKNVCNFAPTVPAKPFCYVKRSQIERSPMISDIRSSSVLFKYQEGMWKSCKEKIDRLIETEYAHLNIKILLNFEEEYNRFLKSEDALFKLLSVVSAVCILICIFGFVSLVSLTCEERRKSIAIRKINGATVGDILAIFTKEYSLLLMIGAVIAFTTGFFVMHRWLELYVKQTSIPAWVYLSILFIMASVIVLCVGWQVYKTSNENPAEGIRN